MKDIPHDLIQKKGFTGLLGVTIAFIVSLLPLGTFTYFYPPHFWTQSETYMSIVLLIGTTLLVVSEARHLRLCAQSEKRIPRTRSDIGSVVGSLLYFTIVGYMVLGAGDFPPSIYLSMHQLPSTTQTDFSFSTPQIQVRADRRKIGNISHRYSWLSYSYLASCYGSSIF